MAVFTEVAFEEAADLVRDLGLGELQALEACSGGIENTNYFASTDRGDYVLTLFERLAWEQLPFYLRLMQHLAAQGIPVPNPAKNAEGPILHRLQGKPAAAVTRLRGRSEAAPTAEHCSEVGRMLARMHLAAMGYAGRQPNLRGLAWWNQTVPVLLAHVGESQRSLLLNELDLQNRITASTDFAALPRGVVHGDLFRDNVLFEDGQLSGILDFYFAGFDVLLFDVAVCLNDWCVQLDSGRQDPVRTTAFMTAYQSVREFTAQERGLLPVLLRAAALRFWVSRLWDHHVPRQAAVLKGHDPCHFERVLRERATRPVSAAIA